MAQVVGCDVFRGRSCDCTIGASYESTLIAAESKAVEQGKCQARRQGVHTCKSSGGGLEVCNRSNATAAVLEYG